MNPHVCDLVTKRLKLNDRGTYFSSDSELQAFTKNDMQGLIDALEEMIVRDILEVCTSTGNYFNELNEDTPDNFTPPAKVLKKLTSKIYQKYNLKRSKAL